MNPHIDLLIIKQEAPTTLINTLNRYIGYSPVHLLERIFRGSDRALVHPGTGGDGPRSNEPR